MNWLIPYFDQEKEGKLIVRILSNDELYFFDLYYSYVTIDRCVMLIFVVRFVSILIMVRDLYRSFEVRMSFYIT